MQLTYNLPECFPPRAGYPGGRLGRAARAGLPTYQGMHYMSFAVASFYTTYWSGTVAPGAESVTASAFQFFLITTGLIMDASTIHFPVLRLLSPVAFQGLRPCDAN